MSATGFLVGGGLGAVAGELTRRRPGGGSVRAGGVGLVVAAGIYPLARRSGTDGLLAELSAVGAATAVALIAARWAHSDVKAARRVVAAGWASHAIYDRCPGASVGSRLPAWYPALCAGYDVAYAATLAR